MSNHDDLHHDGHAASVEFDDHPGTFHGEIVNLRDGVTFQGRSVDELRRAFADSVADDLEFRRHRCEALEPSASGRLAVVVEPGLHRAVPSAARRSGVTPDEWIARALQRAVL